MSIVSSVLSQVTFTVLPNEVFKKRNIRVYFLSVLMEGLLCRRDCVRCTSADAIAPGLAGGLEGVSGDSLTPDI